MLLPFSCDLQSLSPDAGLEGGTLTDVVQDSTGKFAIELLCGQLPEVVDGEGPEVEHVVPREGLSHLQHHHLSS